MAFVVEVDQSGKMEDTAIATVLAFSNGTSYTILIPATVKRKCLQELRRRGRSGKSLYWLLFTSGLFLVFKDKIETLSLIIIDVEYVGHSASIKEHLLNLLKRGHVTIEADRIRFERIHLLRRNPPVHVKAYLTHQGKLTPNRVVRAEELLAQVQ